MANARYVNRYSVYKRNTAKAKAYNTYSVYRATGRLLQLQVTDRMGLCSQTLTYNQTAIHSPGLSFYGLHPRNP